MPTLTWLGRSQTLNTIPQIPCRALHEDDHFSYGDKNKHNLLIQGDNLHALKALLPYFRGQVKCVFIDPPYNTKSAFTHYQDSLEHAKWLDMMYPRLELLRDLLAEDGSIWVTIDDNEAHYLKVIMDEVFGRRNFVANCVWQKKYTRANDARWISDNHDHIICHTKNKEKWKRNLLPRGESPSNYTNPDNDLRGIWASGPCHVKTPNKKDIYEIITPSGRKIMPPAGTSWRFSREKFQQLIDENRVYFGKNGKNIPRYKRFLSEVQDGLVPISLWLRDEVGDNQEAKTEIKSINETDVFSTPKPERLIKRILEIATQKGDLVLDSFLGSGTTAAVAHKMQRRYIGIELGEHAKTHCVVRLQKVIDGEQGGISKSVNWQGGGGFRFYTLGAKLFTAEGEIHPEIKFADLAAYIWFFETHTPYQNKENSPLLGVYNDTAYYLLYNGILKDLSDTGGNILTAAILQKLPYYSGKKIIYAQGCRISTQTLAIQQIQYRHIPHQIPSIESKQYTLRI